MNWKPNKRTWYLLGLALLLCTASLTLSAVTSFARYRTERQEKIPFEVRAWDVLCIGTPAAYGHFNPDLPQWVLEKDIYRMDVAVANGDSAETASAHDQTFHFRLVGTAGLQNAKIYLILPGETASSEPQKILATVDPIVEGTALYHNVGAGWIYTFQDPEGQELIWHLPGGEWNHATIQVTLEEGEQNTDVLLQPMVSAVIPGN